MSRYKLPKVLPKQVDPIPLTIETWREIHRKYQQLVKQREEVQQRVTTAREMGDLSENGAYKYGKWELGNISRQQRELSFLIKHGYAVTEHTTSKVGFGSQVTIQSSGGEQTFTMVTAYESDPAKGKLSLESPLGKALLNQAVGAKIDVETPAGKKSYTIKNIS